MPLKCPKCSRINADKAKECAYCKGSLENAENFVPSTDVAKLAEHFLKKDPKKEAEIREKPKPATGLKPVPARPRAEAPKTTSPKTPAPPPQPPRAKPDLRVIPGGKSRAKPPHEGAQRYWVVMPPTETLPEKKALDDFAKMLGMDPFVVRQKLSVRAPWVIARFPDEAKAAELVTAIRNKDMEVYFITDAELSGVPVRLDAHKVSITPKGLLFEEEHTKVEIAWDDVKLVVKGRMKMELAGETKSKNPLSRLERRGVRPIASDKWEWEVVDIYSKSGQVVRISERDTNYTGLGENRSDSSLKNLRWVTESLVESSLPPVDENYRRLPAIMKPAEAKSDAVARRLGRSLTAQMDAKYLDNSAHFDEYSAIIWIQMIKRGG